MNNWIIPVIVAIVALLMPVSSATVNAQNGTGLSISKTAAPTTAAVGDNITYTYTITNTDNVTISGITLQDDLLGTIDLGGQTNLDAGGTVTATAIYTVVESDLPGPLVNEATVSGTDPDSNTITASATATVELSSTASLQVTKSANRSSAMPHQTIDYTYVIANNGNVTINDLSLNDDKLGTISLSGDTLAPGESLAATAIYIVAIADLPGPIINTATVSGTDSTGRSISATSDPVSVSLYTNVLELFKSEILKLMGVPGKGIENAPGLQKPFNPKSQAAEHHIANTDNVTQTETETPQLNGEGEGTDATPGLQKHSAPNSQATEQLQIREEEENQGEDQQLQITTETQNQGTEEQPQITGDVQNQTGSGHATQNDNETNHGKDQLKHNGATDNQTGTQAATGNGHKSDKGKNK